MLAVAETDTDAADDQIALLRDMQTAARELDYAGIYTYQQGVMMVSSRVVHLVDGTGERERIEILDGAPREYIRHNDTIQT
ncbi:MAG TPA: sigma-E factor regulatory protein RseB domain-containing protein, partial [Burkholderiaceae bacterium]|nr:sigma-E factor regulatory protein RseB domain-containing protein [Burkholderiaceae bacterium]